jgi:hypothetical protein
MLHLHQKAALAAAALSLFAAPTVAQNIVSATPLITVGDSLNGFFVEALNPVFTNSSGQPAALVVLSNGARLIWSNGAVLFDSSTVSNPPLTGGEPSIGFGDQNRFAYSPSLNGLDALYTQNGLLLFETQPIPGAIGLFSTFNSRPGMLPDGRAFWVGGYTTTEGGATEGRILLRAGTAGPSVFETLLRTGDLVDGIPVGTTGIGFGVAMSDDGTQLGNILLLNTGSTTDDGAVRVNNVVVAREGSLIGASAPGEAWQNFSGITINNAGTWLLAGDTSGATATDAFLLSNGLFQVREGSVLDGEALTTPAAIRAVSINNRNEAVHIWNANNVRKMYYASDASRLDLSRFIMRTGSPLDLNGDGLAEATLVDILGTFTSVSAVNLAEDGNVYVHASYTVAGATRESLLRIALVTDAIFANGFE